MGSILCLSAANGQAATGVSGAEALYRQERATCLSGQSHQTRATCLQEAGAALAEARRSPKPRNQDAATLRENALRRCQAYTTPAEFERCTQMVQGAGTRSGSVGGGGVYKELLTREPAAR